MWIYKGHEQRREVIPGVPPTDLTDEEFSAYTRVIDSQFISNNNLEKSGLWEHIADKPAYQPRRVEKVLEEEKESDF